RRRPPAPHRGPARPRNRPGLARRPERAVPGAHRRPAAHGRSAPGFGSPRRPRACRRASDPGRAAGAAARAISASALRRHAPARRPRDRAFALALAAGAGRAHDRARCAGAARDPRPAGRAAPPATVRDALHHPRSCARAFLRGAGRRAARGPRGRSRRSGRNPPAARARAYTRAPWRHSDARAGPRMTPALDLAGVRVEVPLRRGRRLRVLDDVSLTLGRGEILAIVGESGSGKSTLARAIARLVPASGGHIPPGGRGLPTPQDPRAAQFVLPNPLAPPHPPRAAPPHLPPAP